MSAWVRGNLLWKVRIFNKKSEIPQNDLTKPNIEGHVCLDIIKSKFDEELKKQNISSRGLDDKHNATE